MYLHTYTDFSFVINVFLTAQFLVPSQLYATHTVLAPATLKTLFSNLQQSSLPWQLQDRRSSAAVLLNPAVPQRSFLNSPHLGSTQLAFPSSSHTRQFHSYRFLTSSLTSAVSYRIVPQFSLSRRFHRQRSSVTLTPAVPQPAFPG